MAAAATVTQALRPFPQYTTINTLDGGGDRIGHSTYHSLIVKYNKRMASGLTVQASYKLSKLLTDSDSTTSAAGDMYNLRLLKSIAALRSDAPGEALVGVRASLRKREALSWAAAAWLPRLWVAGASPPYKPMPADCRRTSPLRLAFPIGDFSNRPTITTYDNWRGPSTATSSILLRTAICSHSPSSRRSRSPRSAIPPGSIRSSAVRPPCRRIHP